MAEPGRPAQLADIDHIIIMMKENRSFDHYFGTLAGVRGFSDQKAMRLHGGRSVFEQPDAGAPSGVALPFRLDTTRTSAQRLADLEQGWSVQHASLAGGRMDGWLTAHRASDRERGPLTMGYLTRTDLPYYHALADAFTICDGYFCSILGPTGPPSYLSEHPDWLPAAGEHHTNLILSALWSNQSLWARTAFILHYDENDGLFDHVSPPTPEPGTADEFVADEPVGLGFRVPCLGYPERLERAGITWCIYHDYDDFNCNVCKLLTQYRNAPRNSSVGHSRTLRYAQCQVGTDT